MKLITYRLKNETEISMAFVESISVVKTEDFADRVHLKEFFVISMASGTQYRVYGDDRARKLVMGKWKSANEL